MAEPKFGPYDNLEKNRAGCCLVCGGRRADRRRPCVRRTTATAGARGRWSCPRRRRGGRAARSRARSDRGAPCRRASRSSQLRRVERAPEHRNRLVVDAKRHGKRVPVLAAVSERESRGVVETRRRAVHDLGDQRERLKRPGTELLEQQNDAKSARSRSCASASTAPRRRSLTSALRTSWCAGITRRRTSATVFDGSGARWSAAPAARDAPARPRGSESCPRARRRWRREGRR